MTMRKTRHEKRLSRRAWPVIGVVLILATAVSLFILSRSYFESLELQRAESRVTLYRSTLINALERYRHLPFILARDPRVVAAAAGAGRDGLNVRLSDFAREADLEAIYLMDRSGLTVAASNHDRERTFLGQNYGFRPYFKRSLDGARGEFFGIGATTSIPGYFIAEPVRGATGDILGVIALKLDLGGLESAWAEGGEAVFVSNPDGIVILSSDPDWRYHTLAPLTEARRAAIVAGRQFGGEPLDALNWRETAPERAVLNDARFLHVTAAIPGSDWRLHFLAGERAVLLRASIAVVVAAIVAVTLLAVGLYVRARRVRAALSESQAARRKLQAANADLAREIEERRAAEARLTAARTELARAGKLAALGQLSASVTHELGQPISAMKTYLVAAEMDSGDTETLGRLSGIVARMERLVDQLRFFARPGAKDAMAAVDLADVWRGARELIDPDARAAGVVIVEDMDETSIVVSGDALRLEQVLVNLVRNAILAMAESESKRLEVGTRISDGAAILSVRDTGSGLGDETLEKLREPFVTTRASGEGMGLGLAISTEIVKDHGGELSAQNAPGGGAVFSLTLPLATEARAA